MAAAVDHRRLAITTFAEVPVLERTLAALSDAGLTSDQYCLIGRASMIADIVARGGAGEAERDGIALLFSTRVGWPALQDAQLAAATSAPVLEALLHGRVDAPLSPTTSRSEASPESPPADVGHARGGDIALVVRTMDPHQHLVVTRALLANSLHKVTTYEYGLTGPPAGERNDERGE